MHDHDSEQPGHAGTAMTDRHAALLALAAIIVTALSLYSLYAGWSSHQ